MSYITIFRIAEIGKMYTDNDDNDDQERCPICGGPLFELGRLGSRLHMMCRNCGAGFNQPVTSND